MINKVNTTVVRNDFNKSPEARELVLKCTDLLDIRLRVAQDNFKSGAVAYITLDEDGEQYGMSIDYKATITLIDVLKTIVEEYEQIESSLEINDDDWESEDEIEE